ncbi:MAG: TonB-dependent receptor [Dysgonamonadaceae bacterium]|jgi:TonB-linked SusC/RagA family outer membrane protein|nr:TonB-dependent receptor [Dysgonamonadaceae bacterium]
MRLFIAKANWLLSFLIGCNSLAAQITGLVSEAATDDPLPGVTVNRKGTQVYAITGTDGYYRIDASKNDTLVFSFIGLRSLEKRVSEGREINVSLQEDERLQLNEVVVVGYGTQRRRELTGSVAGVSKGYLENSAALSIDGLLSGAVSGVNVTQASGQPGAGSEIRIRGGNSAYASNEPLYVIDGFIYFSEKNVTQAGVGGIEGSLNPLASINPSDIESIEILKDVSAKAIYGSRGANGVVLVTTKKGIRGKNTVHYQYTFGVEQSAKKLNLLNAEQFEKINKEVLYNTTPWYDLASSGHPKTDTDWQDAVLQTGVRQVHEISISGGDDKTRYLLSGNYTDQKGIILNSGYENYSGRINLDRNLYDNFFVGVNASAGRAVQNALTTLAAGDFKGSSSPFKDGITNSLVYALFMPPVLPVYDKNSADGYNHYNPFELTELNYYGTAANPVADLRTSIGQTVGASLLGNFYAKYSFSQIEGLTAKFSAGTNVNYITQNFFAPPTTVLGINQDIQGRGSVGNRRTDVSQTEYLLTYTRQITPLHFIDLLAGYTSQKTGTTIIISKATHLDSFDNLGFGRELPLFSRSEEGNLHSLIGRANYTLLRKYNFTATYRADKSSRFAAGHKWGYFPSIGFSWNVSSEPFFEQWTDVLPTLKFRATYGSAGNQEIGFNEFSAILEAVRYGNEPAAVLANPGNKDLKWETTKEYNAGLDAGFFNDRLTLTADVYYKKTSDLLTKQYLWLEGKDQTFNIGDLTNKGFELSAAADIVRRKRLTWSVAANFARNVNTIIRLGQNDYFIGDAQEQILRTGESVGSFYGFVYDGVVQADEDRSKLPVMEGNVPNPGDIKLRDLNRDNIIDEAGDRTVIGSIQPDFTYGFSTALVCRRWDFFASLQGSQGNEVYNKLRRHLSENNRTRNLSADLLNAWTPENPSDETPRAGVFVSPNYLYSRYVEDGSFVKLRHITLGYTLPLQISAAPVQLRLFLSGQNLLTITRYKGYDPEVAGGIDAGVYPSARGALFGAGITF